MSQQSAISAEDPLQCCCLSNHTQKERQGCYQGRDTHPKREAPNTPSASVAMQGIYRYQKEMPEEGQKSGSMWQVHWSSGLLELLGWSIQDPMQHRTLDMQDARGNFSSTGSVTAAQTSFLPICCPGPAPASIPGPHAVVGAATGPTGSLLTQEAGGPSGLTFLC